MRLSSLVQRLVGILKQLIAKVEIARSIGFNNTSLLHWDRSLLFQVCNLWQSFDLIFNKDFCFRNLPIMGGGPMYLSHC